MKRGMIIGIAAGGVVLILLWYFLLFAPTSSDLNDTHDQVTEAESQKQELENTVRRLKSLSENNAAQEADLRTLRAAVPDNPDLGEFIIQANDIATASGIDWLSISPSPPVAGSGGPNSTIALAIQINGGFFQLLDYLNRLEDLERLVVIDAVNISVGETTSATGTGSTGATETTFDAGSGDPLLSVTLTGRMFTNAEPAGATGSTGGSSSGSTTTPAPTTPTTSSSVGGNS